ncbi:MAG: CRISPR-associated protein Cas4 [Peptococcaceae bacterium]|nr:CRISPR-associated protein Cas4 [Peptococcaceae bacterium]
MLENDLNVTGTLVWYYYICPREVWLMARNITPDQDNPNIDLGRFIGQNTYQRDKREISFGHIKVDVLRKEKGQLVIGEVKKSSKYEKSAFMQLAFYLLELRENGIEAVGELLFPKEKKRVKVELNNELIANIEKAKKDILRIIYQDAPQEPKKIVFCRNCAYAEFCWS